jgi:4-aminobutyrate aminotransferase
VAPSIQTELPGPNARQMIARDEQVTSPSYTRVYPLVAARGRGAVIEDVDGNLFLDFTAGIAVCSTGHCHPRVVEAIGRQAAQLVHMSGTDFYHPVQAELAETLVRVTPGSFPKKVFFTNSGTEAVEAAFKLARYHTRRHQMIAFWDAFHGRTMGALSLTASKVTQRRNFGPLVPGVTHVPYGSDGAAAIRALFRRTVSPDEVAAIFVEPILGEGGYIVPPASFHRDLKAIAEEHGILFVADEVQSGMGRTGRMCAIEHWGVEPDIVCLAKGIASGMPLGAIVAKAEIMDWPPGSHASTFGGNPVACAAALETIKLLEEGLIENAARVGEFILDGLRALQGRHAVIGDVRGKGLMIGVELIDPRQGRPASDAAEALMQACFRRGLLVLRCGQSAIRLCPPLVITQDNARTALAILEDALGELRDTGGRLASSTGPAPSKRGTP